LKQIRVYNKDFPDTPTAVLIADGEKILEGLGQSLKVGTPIYQKLTKDFSSNLRRSVSQVETVEVEAPKNLHTEYLAKTSGDETLRRAYAEALRKNIIRKYKRQGLDTEAIEFMAWNAINKAPLQFLEPEDLLITSPFSKSVVRTYNKFKNNPKLYTQPAEVGVESSASEAEPPQPEPSLQDPPPVFQIKPKPQTTPKAKPKPKPKPEKPPAVVQQQVPDGVLEASIETEATTGLDPDIIRKQREQELARIRKEQTGFTLPATPQGTQPVLVDESVEPGLLRDVSLEPQETTQTYDEVLGDQNYILEPET